MKSMGLQTAKKIGRGLLADLVGGALYAAGVYSFASAAEFAPAGITGHCGHLKPFYKAPHWYLHAGV